MSHILFTVRYDVILSLFQCPLAPPAVTQPWQKGGGDPLSVINIFARQKGQLEETLSHLRTQKLSELRELKTSHTPSDHTHPAEVSRTSSVEDKSSSKQYSLSFPSPSLQNEGSPIVKSHSSAPHSWSSPSPVSTFTATPSHSHLSCSHPSHSPSQHSTITSSHSAVDPEEDIPAITPPGSPSFVDTFSANISSPQPRPPQPVATTNSVESTPTPATTSRGAQGGRHSTAQGGRHSTPTPAGEAAQGGRLSPRSLSLKLQAELTLLETIEDSMRQLAAVEGSQAVSTAQQETATLAQLLETQQMKHQEELTSVTARAQAMAEERKRQETKAEEERAAVLAELERVKDEAERRERQEEKLTLREGEMARQALEATQQLAEARSAASEAVISSARLQVEAAHTMAVSVATAAAREAVTAAMPGVTHPPPSTAPPDLTSTITADKTGSYKSDFDDSVQPDSLADRSSSSIHTELEDPSQLVAGGTSSGDSTLTPVLSAVESDGGGGGEGEREGSEPLTSVQEEEMDGEGDEVCSHTPHLVPSVFTALFLSDIIP